MLYDPIYQSVGSCLVASVAYATAKDDKSTVLKLSMRCLCSLALINTVSPIAVGIGEFLGGSFGPTLSFPFNLVFIGLNLPVIALLGGDEIVESHGSLLPTVLYLAALVVYSFLAATLETWVKKAWCSGMQNSAT